MIIRFPNWRAYARETFAAACILVVAIVGTWWAYRPGLAGAFLFDDFANLPALGHYGPVNNTRTLLYYLTSGTADPTGRPLALLSFLIDAQDWPADPAPFKRTSVLLHLFNGVLLCILLLKLGRAAGIPQRRAGLTAAIGAALWLLHPLWISTTLYVVQREAMLPATFVLFGLLGYLHGRQSLMTSPRQGTVWIILSVLVGTLLAVSSKANGLLLPLLVLVVEHAYLRSLPGSANAPPRLKACLVAVVYPLATAVLVYLAYQGIVGLLHGPAAYRPWTVGQRLLSEPRAIMDYLSLLVAPRPYSRGLFNDDFSASIDLIHPWTTIPAIVLVAGLIAFALRVRKAQPALSLALLFYFAGHTMESTTIPLELYYEHRNYLPALLLFWPLALWLTGNGSLARIKPLLAVVGLLLLALETRAAAALWGEPEIQALVWAAQNPDSPRAQAYAATAERSSGRYAEAEARLRRALRTHPDEIQLAINLLGVRCDQGKVEPGDIDAADYALRNGSNRGPLTFDWISTSIDLVKRRACVGLDASTLQRLIDASWQNQQSKDSPRFQQQLLELEALLALDRGDDSVAEQKLLAALRVRPQADVMLSNAAMLGAHGLPKAGIAQLDSGAALMPAKGISSFRTMYDVHQWLLQRTGYWDQEISHLRKTLEDDINAPAASEGVRP